MAWVEILVIISLVLSLLIGFIGVPYVIFKIGNKTQDDKC